MYAFSIFVSDQEKLVVLDDQRFDADTNWKCHDTSFFCSDNSYKLEEEGMEMTNPIEQLSDPVGRFNLPFTLAGL